jgi:uncharacterized membrane protein (DUF4010 family)
MPIDTGLSLDLVWNFATALLIGVLIGIERERHKHTRENFGLGGLRTFILFALLGALGGWFTALLGTPWPLVATLFAALVAVIAGYAQEARRDPESIGLTTELAALATCLLGAMTVLGYRELAIGLGVIVAAVLAYKQPMHGMVARLGTTDVYAGLRLLIATFVVLPLLPNRPIDPWGVLIPAQLWLLVLLIAGLSLVGYVATRLLGAQRGIPLTGLTGGLVSSTAVTLSFARQSREPQYATAAPAFACGLLLAWTVMFGRVLVAVLVVNRTLLGPLLAPFLAMGLVAAGCAAWQWQRARGLDSQHSAQSVPLTNPFSLASAARFAAFFAAVLVLMEIVRRHAPGRGEYLVAALAGTTDVDAITLSMAQYARTGATAVAVAVTAIVIATLSNTLVKCGIVAALGSPALRRPALLATAAIVVAGSVALSVS